MGQQAALQACFDIHQLGHASAYAQSKQFVLTGLQNMKGKA
jgi:enoyl-CoA hydratase